MLTKYATLPSSLNWKNPSDVQQYLRNMSLIQHQLKGNKILPQYVQIEGKLQPLQSVITSRLGEKFYFNLVEDAIVPRDGFFSYEKNEPRVNLNKVYTWSWLIDNADKYPQWWRSSCEQLSQTVQQAIKQDNMNINLSLSLDQPSTLTPKEAGKLLYSFLLFLGRIINKSTPARQFKSSVIYSAWDTMLNNSPALVQYLKHCCETNALEAPIILQNTKVAHYNQRYSIAPLLYQHGIAEKFFTTRNGLLSLVEGAVAQDNRTILDALQQWIISSNLLKSSWGVTLLSLAQTHETASWLLAKGCFITAWDTKQLKAAEIEKIDQSDSIFYEQLSIKKDTPLAVLQALKDYKLDPQNAQAAGERLSCFQSYLYDQFCLQSLDIYKIKCLIEAEILDPSQHDMLAVALDLGEQGFEKNWQWFLSHGASQDNCSRFVSILASRVKQEKSLDVLEKYSPIINIKAPSFIQQTFSHNAFLPFIIALDMQDLQQQYQGRLLWWSAPMIGYSFIPPVEKIFQQPTLPPDILANPSASLLGTAYEKGIYKQAAQALNEKMSHLQKTLPAPLEALPFVWKEENTSNNILHVLAKEVFSSMHSTNHNAINLIKEIIKTSKLNVAQLLIEKNAVAITPLDTFIINLNTKMKNQKSYWPSNSSLHFMEWLVENTKENMPFDHEVQGLTTLQHLREIFNHDTDLREDIEKYHKEQLRNKLEKALTQSHAYKEEAIPKTSPKIKI